MMCAPTWKSHLPMFFGRNEDWPIRSARFGAYAELAGWSTFREVAEARTAPTSMVGAAPEAKWRRSSMRFCWKTEGKAFSIVHHTPRGAGAESVETLARGMCCVIRCASGNHGTRRGVPERIVTGECEHWQGVLDIVDRVGDQDCCSQSGQWKLCAAVRVATIIAHKMNMKLFFNVCSSICVDCFVF